MQKTKRKRKSKAAQKFCGLTLPLRPVTDHGARPHVENKAEVAAQGARKKTAGPGGAFTSEEQRPAGAFASHATCGGPRVNGASDSRAHPHSSRR